MKSLTQIVVLFFLISSCGTEIKNKNAKVEVEAGTEINSSQEALQKTEEKAPSIVLSNDELLGFWVGYFRQDAEKNGGNKTVFVDEGFMWNRDNKINISIDEIKDGVIKGHSVVAGNDRPFEGTIEKKGKHKFYVQVKEPGDDKYDGEFTFEISHQTLRGQWAAYKDIDIKHRIYTLEKTEFSYDPDVLLENSKSYVDWNKFIETEEKVEYDEGEFEEWVAKEFATATDLIFKLNASNKILAKEQVENLKKGDLTIIRNTIYARHGYSFKNRPLRVFFDAQSWYIPVHTDIKSDFTEIEKQNIELLLRYEKNASEYYDRFGRG